MRSRAGDVKAAMSNLSAALCNRYEGTELELSVNEVVNAGASYKTKCDTHQYSDQCHQTW